MKFPFFKQLDAKDCGASCIRMISSYYGKKITASEARQLCNLHRTGTTMLALSQAGQALGFKTLGVKISGSKLVSSIKFPCIVRLNQNHFVVVWSICNNSIKVGDPAIGEISYPLEEFLSLWTNFESENQGYGFALLFELSSEFTTARAYCSKKQYATIDFVKFLLPHKSLLIQLLFSLLLGASISLVLPFLTQSIIDIGINNRDTNFIIAILIGQLSLGLGLCFNRYVSSSLVLHISNRVSISMISFFLEKLMKMRISFFDSKMIGDILQRIQDFGRIENFLTSSLIGILVAFMTAVIYGTVLLKYGFLLLLVFLMGSVIYLAWIYSLKKYRKRIDYVRFQHVSENQSMAIHYIRGMKEIKLNNCEEDKLNSWKNLQLKMYKNRVDSLTLAQVQDTGAHLIDQSKNVIITFICAYWVINGNLTIGMLIAVTYIIGQLNGPLYQLSSFIQAFQEAQISMERINEISIDSDEDEENKNKLTTFCTQAPIIFKNVSFSYPGSSKKALNNVSFKVAPQTVTAIVGESGGGKSTLLKLLMGFYSPTKGEIYIGSIPLSQIDVRSWRHNCSSVLQDGYLFTESISKNITMKSNDTNTSKIVEAAKLSRIHDFIESLPMKYETIVGEDGLSLSSGQKQRLYIARAIYKDTPFIFLDEATNALDACNESEILESLKSICRNKTVVIVAHRLSTILTADQILVMKDGNIVEVGTHNSLIESSKYYKNLISNQLL